MYAKLINPETHGQKAYNNSGSSAQTLNYLKQEAGKHGQEAAFFSTDKDGLSAADVVQQLDTNVKGLRATDAKFYSLVLSPSADELAHIGDDPAKLKAYTRAAMEQYAGNFQLKDGRKLQSENLVWAATLHHERQYRGTDAEVQAGTARAGEKRPGLQSHVHVVVSARDAEQQVTLNPDGRRQRFDLTKWQTAAGRQFETQFGYTAQAHEKVRPKERDTSRDENRAARIGERVTGINRQVPADQQLDAQRVQQIAQSHEYDKTFYRLLNRVEDRAREGRPLGNVYQLLETGREPGGQQHQQPAVAALRAFQQVEQLVRATQVQRGYTESIGEKKGRDNGELYIKM